MKTVYIHKRYLHLKIKGIWKYADDIDGRYVYLYGELPQNRVEQFRNKNTVFLELIKQCRYTDDFTGCETFWRKRIYVDLFPLANGIVYKDQLEAFDVEHVYETVENPIIEYLQKDLGFKGYSQLVFDREQELKNMLINKPL